MSRSPNLLRQGHKLTRRERPPVSRKPRPKTFPGMARFAELAPSPLSLGAPATQVATVHVAIATQEFSVQTVLAIAERLGLSLSVFCCRFGPPNRP